ncbi:MAG TPA: hypothetical protein VLJ88_07820 [Propionibacteriaceae bacterium]|nr:hypothetical protein [Propionibacteriaceae bacterium]
MSMGAAFAGLLLVVPLAAADPPTPNPTPPKTSADRPWTVEPTADGWRVTWRSATQVPLRDDLPVLIADGRRIGLAQPSVDGRTFTTSTRDARVVRAATVELGWATEPPTSAKRATSDTSADWVTPTGPVLRDDPGAAGRYPVQIRDYDLGDEAIALPALGERAELRGRLYLPNGATGKRPVVLFLHGNHAYCYGTPTGDGDKPWPCVAGTKPVPNYLGYDAMGRNLASRGYVVASISANAVNILGQFIPDSGHAARGELVLASLDLMRRGSRGQGALSYLRDRLDFNRVGLMGHSRGGEGVVRAALQNTQRAKPYGIRGLFLIAPTTAGRLTAPGVSTAVLLPYCDGDLADLQGQHLLDDNAFAVPNDRSFTSGLLMLGANHNYFNTEWSPGSVSGGWDDWEGDPTPGACGRLNPGRLSETEQRRAGVAYLSAFFRTSVGAERKFLPLFDGSGARARSAGDAVVRTTYTAPAQHRLDVARLNRSVPARAATGGARLTVCAGLRPPNPDPAELPDPLPTTDRRHRACTDVLGPSQASHWSPSPLIGSPPGTAVGHLTWTARTGRVKLALPEGKRNVRRYDALTMRMSPDPSVTDRTDLTIRVVDGRGRAARVRVSAVSDALVNLPGEGGEGLLPRTQLRTVRVPLSRLDGISLRNVRRVELLTNRSATGGAYVADVAFTRTSAGRSGPVKLPMLRLSGDPEVAEGPSGKVSHARFTAVLSRPSKRAVTVEWSGSRDVITEYEPAIAQSVVVPRRTGRVTIPAGRTRFPVTIPVVGNDRFGPDVDINAGLTAPSGAVLGANVGHGRALDDDQMPTLRIGPAEARESAGVLRFPVTLSVPSDSFTGVDVRVIEGSARRGQDWQVESEEEGDPQLFGSVPIGQTQTFIEVPLLDDDEREPTENLTLEVGEIYNATLTGPSTVIGTIRDDDGS